MDVMSSMLVLLFGATRTVFLIGTSEPRAAQWEGNSSPLSQQTHTHFGTFILGRNYSTKCIELLTFREEVRSGAILANVKVLSQLAAGFKSKHGVIVEAVVPEQEDSSWLQHLRATFYISACETRPDYKYQLKVTVDTILPTVLTRLPSHTQALICCDTYTHTRRKLKCVSNIGKYLCFIEERKISPC